MNLSGIQSFQKITNTQASAPLQRLQQAAELLSSELLSEAEKSMITSEFPFGQNKKLELYMASGNSRMENPDARGKNLDFRV